MGSEYKVGSELVSASMFAGVPAGARATVIGAPCNECRECSGKAVCVKLADREWHLYDFDAAKVFPATPDAVDMRGQLGQHLQHWTQALGNPPQMDGTIARELEGTKQQVAILHDRLMQVTGSHIRIGDLLGERDRLRNDNHELTTRVAWLERELARARGRK